MIFNMQVAVKDRKGGDRNFTGSAAVGGGRDDKLHRRCRAAWAEVDGTKILGDRQRNPLGFCTSRLGLVNALVVQPGGKRAAEPSRTIVFALGAQGLV